MPLDLQVRILRLIQSREIEKIGATTSTKVDVRIIAATHRNLATMVKQGSFREDLYYRILVVPIHLPPLRERSGDVPELVQHFLLKFREKHGRADLTLQPGLMRHFQDYSWPGNVRELENTMERMVLLARSSELRAADLPEFLLPQPAPATGKSPIVLPDEGVNLEALEREMILQALKKCGGNQTKTARFLGMSRRTLAYRLEKYGVGGDVRKSMKHGAG
jgi:two-component system NtrC family response regulator